MSFDSSISDYSANLTDFFFDSFRLSPTISTSLSSLIDSGFSILLYSLSFSFNYVYSTICGSKDYFSSVLKFIKAGSRPYFIIPL